MNHEPLETTKAPYVSDEDHLVVDHLRYEDDGISHLTAKVGFQEPTDVPPRTRAMLRTKTLLGETYVELTPGSNEEPALADGGMLPPAPEPATTNKGRGPDRPSHQHPVLNRHRTA